MQGRGGGWIDLLIEIGHEFNKKENTLQAQEGRRAPNRKGRSITCKNNGVNCAAGNILDFTLESLNYGRWRPHGGPLSKLASYLISLLQLQSDRTATNCNQTFSASSNSFEEAQPRRDVATLYPQTAILSPAQDTHYLLKTMKQHEQTMNMKARNIQ